MKDKARKSMLSFVIQQGNSVHNTCIFNDVQGTNTRIYDT